MATHVPAPAHSTVTPRVVAQYRPLGSAPSTTYYYRTTGGTRGSTTDAGAIPVGAVVERVT